jgi:hypothetical protein
MSGQPGSGCRGLTIRQQSDYPAPFQVADDAGVSVIAPPGPIIDADNLERVGRRTVTASDHAQERILAYWQHQPFCEACRRSTAKRQTKVMNERVQPRRASRRWSQYPVGETLSEDLAPAQNRIAAEAAGDHHELYDPPGQRQIGHASPIPAMDTPRNRPARWTQADTSGCPNRDDGLITLVVRTLYNKPTRHQTGAVECLLHGADSPPIKTPDIPRTASKVSQSQF